MRRERAWECIVFGNQLKFAGNKVWSARNSITQVIEKQQQQHYRFQLRISGWLHLRVLLIEPWFVVGVYYI